MSASAITLLAIQGAIFLFWIVIAFRFLFALWADALVTARTGSIFPEPKAILAAFRDGAVAPRYNRLRNVFLVVTAVLLVLAALSPLVLS
ncbi:hypothetical protein [Pelagibacterium montanilacus]|uniref:hypothetical protein n=1 Tax=Pelagibacterium montanilacus TaxID=2185280 RepID=UPI000F8D6006|nr:hypothetical protein [Pelagibacterium montanilacus]